MRYYIAIDSGCVPVELAPEVIANKGRHRNYLTSCYRGDDPAAKAAQKQAGEPTQFYLFWGWEHRLPGFNPANQPGFSTHEEKNDGVAYPNLPRGASIPPEWCGEDWEDGALAVRSYSELGIPSHKTYAGMGASEQQHVNLTHRITGGRWIRATKALIAKLLPKPKALHHGDTGLAVRNMARKLHTLGYYSVKPWSPPSYFTQGLVKALTNFQRVYHLPATGVLDARTLATLVAAWNWHTRFNPDGNIKTKGK